MTPSHALDIFHGVLLTTDSEEEAMQAVLAQGQDKLREALEPFGGDGTFLSLSSVPDDSPLLVMYGHVGLDETHAVGKIKAGDIRRARTLITSAPASR